MYAWKHHVLMVHSHICYIFLYYSQKRFNYVIKVLLANNSLFQIYTDAAPEEVFNKIESSLNLRLKHYKRAVM